MTYDLSHLIQDESQCVSGPIQDDEALLLFATIRTMRIHNILEVGGLMGYSARNFSKAIVDGYIYTVDFNPVEKVSDNHIVILKNCKDLKRDDFHNKIDMIFFDAHVYEPQLEMYYTLIKEGVIDDDVLLSFHDTNLHPEKEVDWSYFVDGGWCHQHVERRLVEHFKTLNFDAINFHTKMDEKTIKYRHGITLMKKYKPLHT